MTDVKAERDVVKSASFSLLRDLVFPFTSTCIMHVRVSLNYEMYDSMFKSWFC